MTTNETNNYIQELTTKLDAIIGLLSAVVRVVEHGILSPAPAVALAPAPVCKYTLFEWLEMWFETYKARTLKDGGYDLRNTIEKHVKPNIEDKPLGEYTGLDIQNALNRIESNRMAQISHSVYNQCFGMAVDLDMIQTNPVKKVKRPKHTIEQGRALTIKEHKQFLRRAKDSPLCSLFEFYLLTGCRRNEALSIMWTDITNTSIKISGTKTRNAVRTLPLLPQVKTLLQSIPKINTYVFPYNVDKVRYEFEKIRDKLPFKDFTIHDFRHTFATRCVENGISLKTVQKWLGHADYTTTANIYSHITTDFEYKEMAKLGENVIELGERGKLGQKSIKNSAKPTQKMPKKSGKRGVKKA